MSNDVLLWSATLLVLGACGALLEFRRFSVKELSLLAALAAVAALGRIPFAVLPGVQPTTFFVLVSGLVFGARSGLLVGMTAALVSNMFLGQGPWTVFQMLAWGGCGFTAGLLGRINALPPLWLMVLLGALWSYVFGWSMNFWFWLSYTHPLTLASWLGANAASFWFDTAHAVSTGLLISLFGRETIKIFYRFRKKLRAERMVAIPVVKSNYPEEGRERC